jgi:hypothetical protein
MMKSWTKPVFEPFDVNGEVTAYAGARRDDVSHGQGGAGGGPIARQRQEAFAPSPLEDRTVAVRAGRRPS